MPVQEIINNILGNENDKFPVGMRVLVVDDDIACLEILETMLKKCQYKVTTCNQAKLALELLRENKNKFDIVITDVHMPDMDGLKLLEHISLEMDIPVLMSSANSDHEMVMEAMGHGACDYLLKLVRIEELRNIWQHVIRRKSRVPKVENNSKIENRDPKVITESGNGTKFVPDGKISSRKRKEGDEEAHEIGTDNDVLGAPKRPKVVWSNYLHQKFVDAVNQLEIHGSAVPMKILEHMNVEGLSRECVASHLQKYRLYLKRISSVVAHSCEVSSGARDSTMRMSSFNGARDIQPPTSNQRRYPNLALPSYQTGSLLGRLTSPSTTLTKFNPILLQQKPMELTQLPSIKCSPPYDVNLIGRSINNYFNSAQNEGIICNQSSETFNTITSPNNISNGVFSNLSSNSISLPEALNRSPLVPNDIIDNIPPLEGNMLNNPCHFSSANVIEIPNYEPRGEGLLDIFKNNNNMLPVNSVMDPFGQSDLYQRTTNLPFQGSTSLSYMMHANENVVLELKAESNGGYLMEQQETHSEHLDELLLMNSTILKKGGMLIDPDFGIDEYTF